MYANVALLLIVFNGCKHETVGPELYSEPSQYRHAIFPLSTGNRWSYTDSMSVQSYPPIIYLGSITGYAGETEQGGWMVSNIRGQGSSGEYFIARDTVYALYRSSDGHLLGPQIEFLPPSSILDTAFISGTYSWSKTKVYPLGSIVSTPAGDFDSIYVYEFENPNGTRIMTYFRPGIGVVMAETYYGKIRGDKTVLTAYSIIP